MKNLMVLFSLACSFFFFLILTANPRVHIKPIVLAYHITSTGGINQATSEGSLAESSSPSATLTTPVPSQASKPITRILKAITLETQNEMAQKIRGIFTEEPEIAVAVFRAESGLRPDAMGWNCMYNGRSRACDIADRGNAWSVDCGIAQLNFLGQVCPPESFQPDWNLYQAKEKYDRRGWQPWYAHSSGGYLKFLISI